MNKFVIMTFKLIFMFNDHAFISKKPFACQKKFDCTPEGLITNKSYKFNKNIW